MRTGRSNSRDDFGGEQGGIRGKMEGGLGFNEEGDSLRGSFVKGNMVKVVGNRVGDICEEGDEGGILNVSLLDSCLLSELSKSNKLEIPRCNQIDECLDVDIFSTCCTHGHSVSNSSIDNNSNNSNISSYAAFEKAQHARRSIRGYSEEDRRFVDKMNDKLEKNDKISFYLVKEKQWGMCTLKELVASIVMMHNDTCHSRGRGLYFTCKSVFKCEGLFDLCRFICLTCTVCAVVNAPYGSQMNSSSVKVERPGQLLFVDDLDMGVACTLPAFKGLRWVQVRVDAYTSNISVTISKRAEGFNILMNILNLLFVITLVFTVYMMKSVLMVGLDIHACDFSKLLKNMGVRHSPTPAGHSKSAGFVEKANSLILSGLRALRISLGLPASEMLPYIYKVVDMLNRRFRSDGRVSPYWLHHNADPLWTAQFLLRSFVEVDSKKSVQSPYTVGQRVFYFHPSLKFGHAPRYVGMKVFGNWEEMCVESKYGDSVYLLKPGPNNKRRYNSYRVVAHTDFMRPLCFRTLLPNVYNPTLNRFEIDTQDVGTSKVVSSKENKVSYVNNENNIEELKKLEEEVDVISNDNANEVFDPIFEGQVGPRKRFLVNDKVCLTNETSSRPSMGREEGEATGLRTNKKPVAKVKKKVKNINKVNDNLSDDEKSKLNNVNKNIITCPSGKFILFEFD